MIRNKIIIVEIDDCNMVKRKYHKGPIVGYSWILRGVEKTEQSRIFLEYFEIRTAQTLLEDIKRRVNQG